jgi:hypothetical protein
MSLLLFLIRYCDLILQRLLLLSGVALAGNTLMPDLIYAGSFNAVCSYYSRYEPCTVSITESTVQANLPTDYLDLEPATTKEVNIYRDTGKESNLIVGSASTIIFGPIGLLGFLMQKKVGTVDFGFKFVQSGRNRTAFIRFVNLRVAEQFAEELKPFLMKLKLASQT